MSLGPAVGGGPGVCSVQVWSPPPPPGHCTPAPVECQPPSGTHPTRTITRYTAPTLLWQWHTRFHARCEVYLESGRKIFAFAEKYLWLLAQLTVVMVTGRAVKMMTPSWRVSLWWWWYSHHAGPAWPGRVRRPKHNIIVTTVKKPY